MSKLEPLKVIAKPCPECGSDSTSQTDNHFDPETRCLYETFECDTCGQKWAEKLICERDVEGLQIIDISGEDDDELDEDWDDHDVDYYDESGHEDNDGSWERAEWF